MGDKGFIWKPGEGRGIMKYVTVQEMQTIEREANARGLTYEQMMENAGRGLGEVVKSSFDKYRQDGVLGLVGSGNNGGDTLVALTYLASWGWKASAYVIRPRPADDPLITRLTGAGGQVYTIGQDSDYSILKHRLDDHRVILDGVLGTGIKLPLRGQVAEVLKYIKQQISGNRNLHFIIAVDCPSGVDCDSGEAAPETIPAELTVTMAAVKAGLLKFPAAKYTGKLIVVGIGLTDQDKTLCAIKRIVVSSDWVASRLPERPIDAHKGTFGTTMIVAGSVNYTGAALLAGKAAYLCGCGLVTLAVPGPLHCALAGHFPEATWVTLPDVEGVIARDATELLYNNLGRATALLIGPGFGLEKTTQDFLARLFYSQVDDEAENIRKGSGVRNLPPLVVDADGLKLLSQLPDWHQHLTSNTILTPHPGEMSVMTGIPVKDVQANRLELAEQFSRNWGHILVLKGANTIIASPEGRTAIVPIATSALARAGSGDVLAGLIVGLRSQGVEAFEAAAMGAWIHGQAGLKISQEIGTTASVLAGDILTGIIKVMKDLAPGSINPMHDSSGPDL